MNDIKFLPDAVTFVFELINLIFTERRSAISAAVINPARKTEVIKMVISTINKLI